MQYQALFGEDGCDADRLQSSQQDSHVAGPLRDLPPAQLAFLLDARQRLIDHSEKLKDDRSRDIRHDSQCKYRHAAQVAAPNRSINPRAEPLCWLNISSNW